MIRKIETQDLDAVMQIWLHGNLDAHAFIPASFWRGHFEIVRDMLNTLLSSTLSALDSSSQSSRLPHLRR